MQCYCHIKHFNNYYTYDNNSYKAAWWKELQQESKNWRKKSNQRIKSEAKHDLVLFVHEHLQMCNNLNNKKQTKAYFQMISCDYTANHWANDVEIILYLLPRCD